jgi:hypothetical protein
MDVETGGTTTDLQAGTWSKESRENDDDGTAAVETRRTAEVSG